MKALLLARGLGRRMQAAGGPTALTAAQQAAARAGAKGMMPIGAGERPVPGSRAERARRCRLPRRVPGRRARARRHPRLLRRRRDGRRACGCPMRCRPMADGTARAVLAGQAFAGDDPFLVLNADNLYPAEVLRALVALDGPGLPAFEREALVRDSGFPAERVAGFALLEVDASGVPARHHREALRRATGRRRAACAGQHERVAIRPPHLRGVRRRAAIGARRVRVARGRGARRGRRHDLSHVPRARRGARPVAAIRHPPGRGPAGRAWSRGRDRRLRRALRAHRHDRRRGAVAGGAVRGARTNAAARCSNGRPEWYRFSPGRVEIFGKHTDYAGGHSLLAAVPRGIALVAAPARRTASSGSATFATARSWKSIRPPRRRPSIAACAATCTSSRGGCSSTFPAARSAPRSPLPATCRAPRA